MPHQPHSTSLTSHLSTPHFWWDVVVLAAIWFMVWWLNESLLWWGLLPVALMAKVLGLIGLLELCSFMAFHWLGAARGTLLQGFLGGFISSTAVFVQLTQADRVKTSPTPTLARALLLAMLAMLMECLLIVFTIAPFEVFWRAALPLLAQGLCIVVAVLALPSAGLSVVSSRSLIASFDHPIVWWRVLRFSALIVGLTLGIRWLSSYAQLPLVISSFFLSLFEAHAVLAAAMLSISQSLRVDNGLSLVVAIILGSTISKSLLVLRTRHRLLIVYMLGVLILSLMVVFGVFWWL